MGVTAELVATRYRVSREEQDAFAAESHARAAAAQAGGLFAAEIAPVDGAGRARRGEARAHGGAGGRGRRSARRHDVRGSRDSGRRSDGSVTAGNSSQMTDGAAAVLVAPEAFLADTKLAPLARFVSYAVRGVPPEIMGVGPIEAIPAALARADPQGAGRADRAQRGVRGAGPHLCARSGSIRRVNPTGGAIALGHPLGCTGAKLTATLLHGPRAHARAAGWCRCAWGRMGAAAVFERA